MPRRYILRDCDVDPFGIPGDLEEQKKRYWFNHVIRGKFIEVIVHTKDRIALNLDGGTRKYHWRVENVASGFYRIEPGTVVPSKVEVKNGDSDLESQMFDYVLKVTNNL